MAIVKNGNALLTATVVRKADAVPALPEDFTKTKTT